MQLKDEVNAAAERMTGTRYCLHCKHQRPVAGFRIPVGVKRERCASCADKTDRQRINRDAINAAVRRVGG